MANGLFGGGDGNAETPFLVEDAQDLNAVRNELGKAYKQVADIDLSSYPNWIPIGTSFTGTYSGGGFNISNLNISTTDKFAGLFRYNSGVLTGVNVVSGAIDIQLGNEYIGAIAGYSTGLLEHCSNQGVLYNEPTRVSGIIYVGGVVSRGSVINNCFNTANLSIKSSLGGVTGYGSCTASYNSGNITSLEGSVAGVILDNFGDINNCHNSGNLKSKSNCTGVSGSSNSTLLKCYNTGKVESLSAIACGVGGDYSYDCYNTGEIRSGNSAIGVSYSNSYRSHNTGNLFAKSGAAGITWGNAYNCYALMDSVTRFQNGTNTTEWHKVARGPQALDCYALDSMVLVYE